MMVIYNINNTKYDYCVILNEYFKLIRCPFEITENNLIENFPNYKNDIIYADLKGNPLKIGIFGIVFFKDKWKNKFDTVFVSTKEKINHKIHGLSHFYDAYFDLIVYGGTYATIIYNGEHIEMTKDNNNNFMSKICTYDTPLFSHDTQFSSVFIKTDGQHITYNGILADRTKFNIDKII